MDLPTETLTQLRPMQLMAEAVRVENVWDDPDGMIAKVKSRNFSEAKWR